MSNLNINQDFNVIVVETIGEIQRTLMFKSFEDFQKYETLNNEEKDIATN